MVVSVDKSVARVLPFRAERWHVTEICQPFRGRRSFNCGQNIDVEALRDVLAVGYGFMLGSLL